MADTDNVQVDAPNFLTMSDEDMEKFDPSTLVASSNNDTSSTNTDAGHVEETEEDKAAAQAAADALNDEDTGNGGTEGQTATTGDVASGTAETSSTADQTAADQDGKVTAANAEEKVGDGVVKPGDEGAKGESETGAVDYKAEYDRLLAPFTANGRQIQAKSVDDAIALMQMGANYNKKMAGLKPSLKLVKMLEANGLMDEGQLGFLIDLHKRDPAAINKLIVDSKMDPLDLSTDKASEYKPGNHSIDDREMELDAVLGELKGSKHYDRTLDVVANEWDQESKRGVTNNPQVLKVINGHMESGIFDLIKTEMDSERTFGRLDGLTDLQAYQKVGDAINARGGFNHLFPGSSQEQGKPATPPVVVAPKPKQVEDDKLNEKRRAAGGTKAAPVVKAGVPDDFNPLSLPDEEFKKFKF